MTTDARHSKASPTNIGVHVVQAWSYADSTARLAASGFVAADVGKMAEQQSDETWWLLTNHSPITWKDITASGGGETNTASNVGTAGVGVYKQKTGVDLEFKKINAGSSKVSITDDTGNDEVDIDVVEANLSHANIGGVTSDQHHVRQHALGAAADHTSATLAELNTLVSDATLDDSASSRPPNGAASGDLGGTYPSPTVNDGADSTAIHDNVAAEISAITEKAAPVGADLVVIEDSQDSNNKKRVQLANLPVIQDAESLIVAVRKDSAGTINARQTVYLVGWDVSGGVPTVELADSSSAATMPAFGIAQSTITNLASGNVVVSGELGGLDTSSWSVGDQLYVSETAGDLTTTKPTGTALIQKIGQVTRDHPTFGVIQVFGAGRSNDVPNIAQNNVWMGNASGVATATSRDGLDRTAIHDDTSGEIALVTEKTSVADADLVLIEDSAASNAKKRVQAVNLFPDFGKDYQYEADATQRTNTSTSVYSTAVTLTTPALTGTYRVSWFARVWQSTTSGGISFRCHNTTDSENVGERLQYRLQHTSDKLPGTGFEEITFTGAAKTFEVQWRAHSTGTAYIQGAFIEIWKVPS